MSRRAIFGSLLVISLAANVYLWSTRDNAQSSPRPTLKPRVQREPPRGLPDFKWTPTATAVPSTYASEDRAALEKRLVEIEARLDELLQPEERYAIEPRSTETEAKVAPYLDKVFKPLQGTEPKYRVECHGKVCKVDSDIREEWTLPLQELVPGREMFGTMSFGRSGIFIELDERPVGLVEGKRMIAMIMGTALESSDCGVSSATGTLRLTFSIDAGARTIRVATDGPLATREVGICFRKAIEDTIARGYVSPNVTSLPPDSIELTFPLTRR